MSRSRKNRRPRRKPRYEVQLRAQLQAEDAASPDPTQVVDTLNQSSNLYGLRIGTRDAHTRIEARLGFDTEEDLLAWRDSSSLQKLITAVRGDSSAQNTLAMRVRRRKR